MDELLAQRALSDTQASLTLGRGTTYVLSAIGWLTVLGMLWAVASA